MATDGLFLLTDDEKTVLTALLRRTIADDRYPLSTQIGTLRGVLALPPANRPVPSLPKFHIPIIVIAQSKP
jgi:hypothetical protein